MEKTEQKKQLLTEKMADHLLQHGFADFTLRSLGTATGTSDRMLLHYFADKDELLAATLTRVAERLLANLRSLQPGKMNEQDLIDFLATHLKSPEIVPYTNLWLELTAVAIRQGDPYRTTAAQIAVMFLEWIKSGLDNNCTDDTDPSAAFVLTVVEGLVLLNAIGKEEEASRALGWVLCKE